MKPLFRKGDVLTADAINQIIDGRLRQILGGKGIKVASFGDRVVVSLTEELSKRYLPQANEVITDTTEFDGNLSADDDTVQKALETLDELVVDSASAGEDEVIVEISEGVSAGMAIGDMVVARLDTGDWITATLATTKVAYRKGVCINKLDDTTAEILTAGRYTFATSQGLSASTVYGIDSNNDGQAGLYFSLGGGVDPTFIPFFVVDGTDTLTISMVTHIPEQMDEELDGDKLYDSDFGLIELKLNQIGDTIIFFNISSTYDDGTYSDLSDGAWGFFYVTNFNQDNETADLYFFGMVAEENGSEAGHPDHLHSHYRTSFQVIQDGQAGVATKDSLTDSYTTISHPSVRGLTIQAQVATSTYQPSIFFTFTTDEDIGVCYVQLVRMTDM